MKKPDPLSAIQKLVERIQKTAQELKIEIEKQNIVAKAS